MNPVSKFSGHSNPVQLKPRKNSSFTIHAKRKSRRLRANYRERNRMRIMNDAMAELKKLLPACYNDKPPEKLSKIEALRTAYQYIADLKRILVETDDKNMAEMQWSNMAGIGCAARF